MKLQYVIAWFQSTQLIGWFARLTCCELHCDSVPVGVQLPALLHASYSATVASRRCMQKPGSVSECCGCSSASPSEAGEPIMNVPDGTRTNPGGQLDAMIPSACASGV